MNLRSLINLSQTFKYFKHETTTTRRLYLAPPFLIGDYEPRACKTYREGKMSQKVNLALKELENCVACPRNCKVNRMEDKKGACNTGRSCTLIYLINLNFRVVMFQECCRELRLPPLWRRVSVTGLEWIWYNILWSV